MDTRTSVIATIKKVLNIEYNEEIPNIESDPQLSSIGIDSIHRVEIMVELESFFNTNLEVLNLERAFLESDKVSDMVNIIEKAILQKPISWKVENHYSLSGAEIITVERNRQISEEGYSLERDKEYTHNELVMAAICYTLPPENRIPEPEGYLNLMGWPWDKTFWKPGNYTGIGDPLYKSERIRELTKAGALIAAEIDRLKNS